MYIVLKVKFAVWTLNTTYQFILKIAQISLGFKWTKTKTNSQAFDYLR